MARSTFGGTALDGVFSPYRFGNRTLLSLATATLTFWDAETDGTRYTDLLDENGQPASAIVTDPGQVPAFQGPDGVTEMWADDGDNQRTLMVAQGRPGDKGDVGPSGGPIPAGGNPGDYPTPLVGGGYGWDDPSGTYAPLAPDVEYVTPETAAATYGTREALLAPRERVGRNIVDWLTTFAPGHGWTFVGNGLVSSGDDTTTFALGKQSIKMVINTGNLTGQPSKTGLPATDWTDKHPIVWLKIDDWSKVERIEMHLGTGGFANYQRLTKFSPASGIRPTLNGRWTPVQYTMSDTNGAVGAPVRTNVDAIRLNVVTSSPTPASTVTVHVGGVGFMPASPAFPNGVVTFTFDDGWDTQYTAGRPALDRHGFAGTLYTVAELVDTPGFMTLDQLKALRDRHGWEIAAHAFTQAVHVDRITSITPDELDAELRSLREWLLGNGFPSESYCYPGGVFDAASVEVVKRYFSTARTTSKNAVRNVAPPPDPYFMTTYDVNGGVVASAQAQVDNVIANGEWLVFMIHNIEATGGITEADFTTLVDYVAASGVEVLTVQEVIARSR